MSDIEKNSYSNDIEINSMTTSDFISFGFQLTGSYTVDDIRTYVDAPMVYNKQVRKISKDFYNSSGQYHQIINNQVANPTLDYITTPYLDVDENSIKQRNSFNLFIKKMLHKRATRDIIRTDLLDGMYVGILRSTKKKNGIYSYGYGDVASLDEIGSLVIDENIAIQPLNLDYCKVIGLAAGDVQVAAFDMQYFDEFKHGGLIKEIKTYPSDFIIAYKNYKKDSSKRWYVLNPYTTIVLKLNADMREPYGRPYGIAALTDIKTQEDYEANKNKVISELASTIYALNLPAGKETGTCSLNKTQQASLIDVVEDAIKLNNNSTASKITFLSLPPGATVSNIKKDSNLTNDKLSDENSKKVATSLAFAESALNGSSEGGASYASLQVNLDILSSRVFEILERISEEYTRVFNFNLFNSKTPIIDFEYLPINQFNRDTVYKNAKELYNSASGSKRVLIACAGFNQDSYIKMMELEKFEKLDEKYPPHLTSYTASDSADKPNPDGNLGGRDKVDDKDLSLQSQTNKNSGAN